MGHYRGDDAWRALGSSFRWEFVKIGQSQAETRRLCCLRTAWMSTCFRLKTDRGPGSLNIATANPGLLRHGASFATTTTELSYFPFFSTLYRARPTDRPNHTPRRYHRSERFGPSNARIIDSRLNSSVIVPYVDSVHSRNAPRV